MMELARYPPLAITALILIACAPNAPPRRNTENEAPPLAHPNVIMAANPAPPFTYWAPEGSTIANHPNVPGVWQAEVRGRSVAIYFGDACRASTYQSFVGRPLETFPNTLPHGVELRTHCTTCAVNQDLRANRLNVAFDDATHRIGKVACY